MKTIGIITYHHSYNYGTILQAYATQLLVEKKGYKTEFIDSNEEIYPEHTEKTYIEEPINDYIKEKDNDIISENNTLDDYYNINNNSDTILKTREDSLNYDILKDYIIESFKEKMMDIYNSQNLILEKKT